MLMIKNSYVGVRLASQTKGTIEKFSLIFIENLDPKIIKKSKEFVNISINKLIDDSKQVHMSSSEKNKSKPTLNKLLRVKFNKFNLLVNEQAFWDHEVNMRGCKGHQTPVGFVQNSGFTLVNGRCSANAFVLTTSILELIEAKKNVVAYRTPSCSVIREARIKHFFIC